MQEASKTVLEQFQIRKTKKQKAEFRDWLCEQLSAAGYAPKVERKWNFSDCRNVVVGDPDRAKVLFTAHYDTCAVLPIPNFVTPRSMVWYLLYQMLLGLLFILFGAAAVAIVLLLGGSAEMGMLAAYAAVVGSLFWMMGLGRANRHTANDNTSGVITLLEIALSLPEEVRSRVCIVFFDNEEKGLFGSSAFAGMHKAARKRTLTVNFDCVSDGDRIRLFPKRAVKRNAGELQLLEESFLPAEGKETEVVQGFGFYPSDQECFTRGVGVCALQYSRVFGEYMGRIHTGKDTVFDERNIELLRQGAVRLAERIG